MYSILSSVDNSYYILKQNKQYPIMVSCDDEFLWNIIERKLNDSGVPAGRIRAVYHAFLKEARKIMHQGGNQLSIGGIIDKDKYQA